jgi:MFS transporter, AAHS family, benzoate transport protein
MRTIELQGLADEARLNRFHYTLLFWSALMIVFDGYDLAVVGITLPAIMKQMNVDSTRAGIMISAALFGMMFGNVLLGTLAERIGRRRTILLCVVLFSAFTAGSGLTTTPLAFGIARFVAGLGIGGVMPNIVSQMTEYAPRRVRSTMVTLMFSGYSVGGMLAALLGKSLIHAYGWPSLYFAAALPLVLLPFALNGMPESIVFLIKNNRLDALRALAQRIDPACQPTVDDRFVMPRDEKTETPSLAHLFRDGRAIGTAMFWVACFMCLFMVYALSPWLTKLMAGAGYELGSALTFVLVLNLGAVFGAIGGGWLADKLHIRYVLIGMYVLAAVSIALLGYPFRTAGLMVLVALAGASTIGTQIVTIAYAGQFYPTSMRTTGIGWALGIGRAGAICAPIVLGALMAMQLPLQQNFMAISIPAAIAAVAIWRLDRGASGHALA